MARAFWRAVILNCAIALVFAERRVLPVTRGLCALAAGAALGKCLGWSSAGVLPVSIGPAWFNWPGRGLDRHARALFDEILPAITGMPRTWELAPTAVWICVGAGALAAAGILAVKGRGREILGVLRVGPGRVESQAAFLCMLVLLPALGILRGGAEMPHRYWVYLLPAAGACFGLALARAWEGGAGPARKVLGAVLLLALGASMLRTVEEVSGRRPFEVDRAREVARHLEASGVEGGLAEYDLAHTLTLVSGERLFFAPFDYKPRIPGTSARLGLLKTHAWLFHLGADSADRERSRELAGLLADGRIPYRREEVAGFEIFRVEGLPLSLRWQR